MGTSEIKSQPETDNKFAPTVETVVFDDSSDARFWIGRVATMDDVILSEEYTAARQLRANVYIDKEGFLPESFRMDDGGESDADDNRSIQFAVIENCADEYRLVGTSRLIVKRHEDEPLPVETMFSEAFAENPAPIGSTEASRFIAEYPNKFTKHLISLSGIRAMELEALNRGFEPIYAVIEEKLAGMFKFIGIPFEQMTELRYLEEYSTPNMAVEIDPNELMKRIEEDITGQLPLSQFFQGSLASLGLGYYDENLQRPIDVVGS